MNNINSVVVSGRMVKDFEPYRSESGIAYGTLSIASNRYDSKSKSEVASFFDISVVGHNAEALSKYACKGTEILVKGELVQRQYQDKQGNTRNSILINADMIEIISNKKTSDNSYASEEEKAKNDFIRQNQNRVVEKTNDITDDELPF